MTIMSYFDEIDEHFNPELICGIGLKDDGRNIISEFLNDLNKMFGSCLFLHN